MIIAAPSVTAKLSILMILYQGLIINFHSALNNVATIAVILFKSSFLKERKIQEQGLMTVSFHEHFRFNSYNLRDKVTIMDIVLWT